MFTDIQTKNINPIDLTNNIGSIVKRYKNGYFTGNLVSQNNAGIVLQYGGNGVLNTSTNQYYKVNADSSDACFVQVNNNIGRERTAITSPIDGYITCITYYKEQPTNNFRIGITQ
jgi:hypothetical protein